MALQYSYKQLIQRITKHVNDGLINDSFSISDNEVLLYITDAIAYGLVGGVFNMAKVTGVMEVPEAYLITYLLPAVTQDPVSGHWVTTLPQPPVSLALGYSINRVFFSTGTSQSMDVLPIKSKRVAYRIFMPMPVGIRYWVENKTIWLAASDNMYLGGNPLYVQMPITRAINPDTLGSDITQPLNMPDDAIDAVFNMVIKKIAQREQMPRDIISDDLPAGATNINK